MINVKKIINKKIKSNRGKDLWVGSNHQNWKKLKTPQAKGSVGTEIYKAWLESQGHKARIVSDEGDIEWSTDNGKTWVKDEVKAATATVNEIKHGKNKGMITEKIWVNQIRPAQKSWKGIVIVGVYPNHVKIFRKSRQEWDKQYSNLTSVNEGMKHNGQTGEEQLEQVTLVKNQNRNNFGEWNCIYSDQKGETV
jgi:hypothetical protein